MKILIASDSYKGSLSSDVVASHIENGVKRVYKNAETIKLPIGDGGEGTLDAIQSVTKGILKEVDVVFPNLKNGKASYLILDDKSCFIEVATATGLHQTGSESILDRNSIGTGSIVKDAIENGFKTIYVALGGSGTNDYGIGILHALGFRFYDKGGLPVPPFPRYIPLIEHINTDHVITSLDTVSFHLLCDVSNPLFGNNGAAYVFGPQKGATKEEIMHLEKSAKHFNNLFINYGFSNNAEIPGSGAAGGIGYALSLIGTAYFKSGINTVLDIVKFESLLEGVDLVITGEGMIDSQSINGKTPVGIAKRAHLVGIPTVAIVGSIGTPYREVYDHHIVSIEACVTKPQSIETAINHTSENIENAAERLMRFVHLGMSLNK